MRSLCGGIFKDKERGPGETGQLALLILNKVEFLYWRSSWSKERFLEKGIAHCHPDGFSTPNANLVLQPYTWF